MSVRTKLIFNLAITVTLLLLAVASAAVSFGWFVSGESQVNASGLQISLKGDLEILLSDAPDAEDIGVFEPSEEMEHISRSTPYNLIRPGSAGCVDFYVRNPKGTPYTLAYELGVANDAFCEAGSDGFYPNTDAKQEEALRYINSHVMFFSDCTDGVYSGWLGSGEAVRLSVADGSAPQHIQVYWVWVPWYDDIFGAENETANLIAQADRERIQAYYLNTAPDASGISPFCRIFAGAEQNEKYFNDADYVIGTTIKHLCIDVKVWEE